MESDTLCCTILLLALCITLSCCLSQVTVVKDDCVGSCFIELQPLHLSNLQITPIYCSSVYFRKIVVHFDAGIRQVVLDFFVLTNDHRIHGCTQHRMPPFLDVFPARNQSRLDDGVWVMGASNVTDVLGEVVR